jgi:hypothetical protein
LAALLAKRAKRKISRTLVSKWENGFKPRREMRLVFAEVTGGKVKPERFIQS